MRNYLIGLIAACGLAMAGAAVQAQPEHEHEQPEHQQPAHKAAPPKGEVHPGPKGYHRVTAPQGWNARPKTADPGAYKHNYQAARSYKIGPYHRPSGWAEHHWAHGETLPRAYWAPDYILSDYWLFSLEVPPEGYEWVRDDTDALLVNTSTGEILQVEYGVFG